MSAYAISDDGYRAIDGASELHPGEVLADVLPVDAVAKAAALRARSSRNQLLRASDWTQALDVPLSDDERAAWCAYRQALRDLPQQAGFPDCTWPTAPDA